jgi:hypothetical protein
VTPDEALHPFWQGTPTLTRSAIGAYMLCSWCVVEEMVVRPEYRANDHFKAAHLQRVRIPSR